ncbi:hypothetical protein Acin_2465 [Acidaminococcus intestini RyC-MR95]|uniref:Uncharacterized protein n=1 Tax=Acidaminococcus intestini (strain RyC-MR95) TaxID=568816 RepID=G4Q8E7_ACIIR|nr:hypothetical protein Acin_2465 [Acidaminococcus intestini RyC-MR95]
MKGKRRELFGKCILFLKMVKKKAALLAATHFLKWSGQWESNPPLKLGKLSFYQ